MANQLDEADRFEMYEYDSKIGFANLIATGALLLVVLAVGLGYFAIRNLGIINPRITSFWMVNVVFNGLFYMEVGLVVFLIHSLFLLPRNASSRFVGPVGAMILAGTQMMVLSHGNGVAVGLSFSIGLFISGWLLQRFTGASLSMNGTEVFQRALSTNVFLLMPLLFIVMGVVPVVLSAITFRMDRAQLAPMFIYAALTMMFACFLPLIVLYFWMIILKWQSKSKCILGIIGIIMAIGCASAEWSTIPQYPGYITLSLLACVVGFSLGLGIGYRPFHYVIFRPAWAKRRVRTAKEQDVAFDDMD